MRPLVCGARPAVLWAIDRRPETLRAALPSGGGCDAINRLRQDARTMFVDLEMRSKAFPTDARKEAVLDATEFGLSGKSNERMPRLSRDPRIRCSCLNSQDGYEDDENAT